jgi:glyoxylase-like metal-dependent hydrolase (beta-lactamase superfamily II)
MAVQIPYVREIEFEYGTADEVTPLIRRVIAGNPSAFTYKGTGTYIVGHGNVAVIDPGPMIEAHVEALMRALKGETVTHILITHTHSDHSPAAAPLKALTGAKTYGYGPHGSGRAGEDMKVEEDGDMGFVPDVEVRHGDILKGDGWTIECVFTPGHTSNHMCFALKEEKALFTGDHVMGWSTSVVAPPDGSMVAYMASLEKLGRRDETLYFSGHGPDFPEAQRFVRFLIRHRQGREASILHRLSKGETDIATMVRAIYIGIDPRLMPAAGYSVLAHLEDLVARGVVATDGDPVITGTYRMAT